MITYLYQRRHDDMHNSFKTVIFSIFFNCIITDIDIIVIFRNLIELDVDDLWFVLSYVEYKSVAYN